jgi:cell shape-determining protein MreC
MGVVERYERLKAELASLKDEQSRRLGGVDAMMKRLREEFGLKSLEAAERELASLSNKRDRLESECEEELDGIEEEIK